MKKPDPREVALRLRAIIQKLGLTPKAAAHELGMTRERLNNSLNGYALPRYETVYALQKMLPGITMEWVYFGNDHFVPDKLGRELAIFTEAARQRLESGGSVPGEGGPVLRQPAANATT